MMFLKEYTNYYTPMQGMYLYVYDMCSVCVCVCGVCAVCAACATCAVCAVCVCGVCDVRMWYNRKMMISILIQ